MGNTINFVDTGKGVTMQINSGLIEAIKSDPKLVAYDASNLTVNGLKITSDDVVQISGAPVSGNAFARFTALEQVFPKFNAGSGGSGGSAPITSFALPDSGTSSNGKVGGLNFQSLSATNLLVGANAYFDGSKFMRDRTGTANVLQFTFGNTVFYQAPTGPGGTEAAMTQVFLIGPDGTVQMNKYAGTGKRALYADSNGYISL